MSEISEIVNYQSESHFYRLFKKRFQLTPKQYRLLIK
ncbi:AraC family transcriptional regulator [Enterococcus avium]|nr:AraC family transcriptional regulator [Enterococcus avium]